MPSVRIIEDATNFVLPQMHPIGLCAYGTVIHNVLCRADPELPAAALEKISSIPRDSPRPDTMPKSDTLLRPDTLPKSSMRRAFLRTSSKSSQRPLKLHLGHIFGAVKMKWS